MIEMAHSESSLLLLLLMLTLPSSPAPSLRRVHFDTAVLCPPPSAEVLTQRLGKEPLWAWAEDDDFDPSISSTSATMTPPKWWEPFLRSSRPPVEDSIPAASDGPSAADEILEESTTDRPQSLGLHRRRRSLSEDLHRHSELPGHLFQREEAQSPWEGRPSLPWECRMEEAYLDPGPDVFPPVLRTGRCLNDHCVDKHHRCVPRHYSMRVLRRVADRCVPVPRETSDSSYEEEWEFVRHDVVVACECQKKQKTEKEAFSSLQGSSTVHRHEGKEQDDLETESPDLELRVPEFSSSSEQSHMTRETTPPVTTTSTSLSPLEEHEFDRRPWWENFIE